MRITVTLVLIAFGILTGYAAISASWDGLVDVFTGANLWTIQVMVDLVIALAITIVWMVRDARRRGMSATPYVILTFATGSFGPLAYLLRRAPLPHNG